MTDKVAIFSTCASEEDAKRIATRLVELRLAACVQILPGAASVYCWKGAIETAAEYVLIIKSRRDLVPSIEHEFEILHPYDVPELIAVPIVDGGAAYLRWLGLELKDGSEAV